jgi:hypothetical protein
MEQLDRRTFLKAGAVAVLTLPVVGHAGARARAALAADPAVVGSWSSPFDMTGVAIHATLTQIDDILFFSDVEGIVGEDHTNYAATWNWRTGAIQTAPLPYSRDNFCSGHVVLPDGRIFLAGGHALDTGKKQDPIGVPQTDTYDPTTRAWAQGPDMTEARWYPTAVNMPNRKVLIFGGQVKPDVPSSTVEEYDPATNTVRTLPSTATKVLGLYPRMHLLPSGRVLKAGPQRSTPLFNPATNSWSSLAPKLFGTRIYGSSALLPGGRRVLVVGGQTGSTAPPTGTAEILDTSAASPAWRYTGSLTHPRLLANLVTLPDGKLIIIGGGAAMRYTNPVKVPEMYDPAAGTWTPMAAQQAGRMYHATAALLPDGRVLSAGQDNGSLANYGEIFSPPYLFKGARPTITAAPTAVGYGQTLTITTPDAGNISSVTVIRAASVTHQIDTDQRSVPLTFTSSGGSLAAKSPASAALAPPGYYLLFIVNKTGVPSVAPWLKIG